MMRLARWVLLLAALAGAQPPGQRTSFRVKSVAAGVVYLDGGSSAGLAEGMRLTVRRLAPGEPLINSRTIGEITILSVASNSAACEVKSSEGPVEAGDTAQLSAQDAQVVLLLSQSKGTRKYAQVVTFTEGDPLEEEVREYVPRPQLPEVNRVRGRIGFEHNAIYDRAASGAGSFQDGVVLRADMTRIGGSYWNFTGYWRGRVNSRSRGEGQQTLSDLMNRTYHIGMYYNNPRSANVAGFGRLLLPWAASLSTIDGGYFGRRLGKVTTVGIFGGSTPDPTAWNYDPNRQMIGAFASFEAGNFESVRVTSTAGLALTRIHWKAERQFAFFENGLFYKRYLSIYHNLEADQLRRGRFGGAVDGPVVSRSYLTFRVQPATRVSFDLSHNYFRSIPTFDTRLIGTGLLDRLLFQGLSGGVRLDVFGPVTVYANLGRSKRDEDARGSWNQMYGLTAARFSPLGLRADLRYSRFDSSFGKGSYESLSFSREIGDRLRLDLQIGQQDFQSMLTRQSRTRYLNTMFDWFLGDHYAVGSGFTLYRGQVQNYDQFFVNAGYRF